VSENPHNTNQPEVLDALPETALAVRPVAGGLMPAMSFEQAALRRNQILDFAAKQMREGVDYGIIPGTNDKRSLYKPGAEKLCSLFGLAPSFQPMAGTVEDFDRGVFHYRYRCVLSYNGAAVGEGVGSCNSMEKKYRYRTVNEQYATAQEKEQAVGRVQKDYKGRTTWVLQLPNTDIYSQVNTLDKMAQKRALIAATLIALNASEMFTQDLEDSYIQIDDDRPPARTAADVSERLKGRAQQPPAQKPQQPATPAREKSWGDQLAEECMRRQFSPQALRSVLDEHYAHYRIGGEAPVEFKAWFLDALKAGKLDKCFAKYATPHPAAAPAEPRFVPVGSEEDPGVAGRGAGIPPRMTDDAIDQAFARAGSGGATVPHTPGRNGKAVR
jgi:hypothetical protein